MQHKNRKFCWILLSADCVLARDLEITSSELDLQYNEWEIGDKIKNTSCMTSYALLTCGWPRHSHSNGEQSRPLEGTVHLNGMISWNTWMSKRFLLVTLNVLCNRLTFRGAIGIILQPQLAEYRELVRDVWKKQQAYSINSLPWKNLSRDICSKLHVATVSSSLVMPANIVLQMISKRHRRTGICTNIGTDLLFTLSVDFVFANVDWALLAGAFFAFVPQRALQSRH